MPFLVEIGMSSERRTVLVQFVVMGGDSWLHLTQAKFISYVFSSGFYGLITPGEGAAASQLITSLP